MRFDLQKRTLNFSTQIVRLLKILPKDTAGIVLGKQLIRSATSIGANLEEADAASSRKDFFYKISICLKEAKETKYWLNIIISAQILNNEDIVQSVKNLLQEATELSNIFYSITKKK